MTALMRVKELLEKRNLSEDGIGIQTLLTQHKYELCQTFLTQTGPQEYSLWLLNVSALLSTLFLSAHYSA